MYSIFGNPLNFGAARFLTGPNSRSGMFANQSAPIQPRILNQFQPRGNLVAPVQPPMTQVPNWATGLLGGPFGGAGRPNFGGGRGGPGMGNRAPGRGPAGLGPGVNRGRSPGGPGPGVNRGGGGSGGGFGGGGRV
jgi:hypothetical protein